MTTFQDGPAKGKTLMLKRTPIFLRVVIDGMKVDALDQLEDTPLPREKLVAYVAARDLGAIHLNAKGGRGGFYRRAEYKLVPIQPTDGEMRDPESWSRWCHAQPAPIVG
jgi:hypothetical protein